MSRRRIVITVSVHRETLDALARLEAWHGTDSRSDLIRKLVTKADNKRAAKVYRATQVGRDIPGQLTFEAVA